jgi:hypothetical protein
VRLYVASSWRNPYQQDVVAGLRDLGHQVYDFRNPKPGDAGFSWKQVGGPLPWKPSEWREALRHPRAAEGFRSDFEAMAYAHACVLVLPSGRSAHLEAGYMAGQGKPVAMYLPEAHPEPVEPDLMVELFNIVLPNPDYFCVSLGEVERAIESWGL